MTTSRTPILAFATVALLTSSPAHAYRSCDGLLTSNNSCVGSESNVDRRSSHEPIETGRRDYIEPDLRDYQRGGRDRSHGERRERYR